MSHDFAALVAAAKEEFSYLIRRELDRYEQRQADRVKQKIPVLCFVGHGRCGKDEAGSTLARHSDLMYHGSTSSIVVPMIAWCQKLTVEEAWTTRHTHRAFWFQWCNEFRRSDPTIMIRMSLGRNDICAGPRSWIELREAVETDVVDVPVWINRLETPPDPTMEYDAGDVLKLSNVEWIDNNRSLSDLKQRVLSVATRCGIRTYSHPKQEDNCASPSQEKEEGSFAIGSLCGSGFADEEARSEEATRVVG